MCMDSFVTPHYSNTELILSTLTHCCVTDVKWTPILLVLGWAQCAGVCADIIAT
jgi:hypothetical protein